MNKQEAIRYFKQHTLEDRDVVANAINALGDEVARIHLNSNTVEFYNADGVMMMDFSSARIVWRPEWAPANARLVDAQWNAEIGAKFVNLSSGRTGEGAYGTGRRQALPAVVTCGKCNLAHAGDECW